MGTFLSAIYGGCRALAAAVRAFYQLNADLLAVLKRATSDPGLPSAAPTASYWLRDPPFPELVDARSDKLPETAHVAIVGSGITAAAVARTLLHEARRKGERKKVVVLEARQLASGATGRNGGHIKPASYADFALLKSKFGPDRAAAIVRFQHLHLKHLPDLCRQEAIHVAECREVDTVDLFLDTPTFDKAAAHVRDLQSAVPELRNTVFEASDARKEFHAGDHVVGAIAYPAGALWPYRLVAAIWKDLTAQFRDAISMETTTPVEAVALSGSDDFPFLVCTSRGTIKCRHVVHATNAFASHLVPGLRDKMTGLRAHMSAQRPGGAFADCRGARSWSFIYGQGFDYMTQRPPSASEPGDLMLGGGFFRSLKQGLDQVGVWDDASMDAMTATHLNGILPTVFDPHWGADSPQGRLKQMWSGTICFTADAVPFVGRLDSRLTGRHVQAKSSSEPDSPAEWISAGYHGDGMIYAWLCGSALGLMLAGSENDHIPERPGLPRGRLETWFPKELLVTYDRVKNINLADLASEL